MTTIYGKVWQIKINIKNTQDMKDMDLYFKIRLEQLLKITENNLRRNVN
jgi:hypothetical protein